MCQSKKSKEEEARNRHIEEMKKQLEHRFGESGSLFISKNLSPRLVEKFLEHILFMESAAERPLFDALEQMGVLLPAPASLDEPQLQAKLWEVINAMALLGQYLSRTDHLSDRQLYELLWEEILREPTTICSGNPNFACHIDILGGYSEEDILLNLKYYADEDERLDWADEFPEGTIPPHEDPPFDRDRLLPKPPDVCASRP